MRLHTSSCLDEIDSSALLYGEENHVVQGVAFSVEDDILLKCQRLCCCASHLDFDGH